MYNEAWLVRNLGIPKSNESIKFNVEYITKGGNYTGTNMEAPSISEVVEKVFIDAKNRAVGRMVIKPVVLNESWSFQLLNADRI